ncbi:MAG: hypothetical protein ACYTEZ_03670 [Planctomycetota bacterium]|jgi:hypothetical protein
MGHRTRLSALVAIAVALAAPGCGGGATVGQLVGTWTLDVEATKELPHFKAMPEEVRAGVFKSLGGMMLEVTFTKNTVRKETGLLEGSQYREAEEGTYEVVKRAGTRMVLAITSGKERTRIAVDLQGDRLVLDMDEAKSVLRRK